MPRKVIVKGKSISSPFEDPKPDPPIESSTEVQAVNIISVNKAKTWDDTSSAKCVQLLSTGASLAQIANEMGRSEIAIKFRRNMYVYNEIQKGKSVDDLSKQLHLTDQEIKEGYETEIQRQKQNAEYKKQTVEKKTEIIAQRETTQKSENESKQTDNKTKTYPKKNKQKNDLTEDEDLMKIRDLIDESAKLTEQINKRFNEFLKKNKNEIIDNVA